MTADCRLYLITPPRLDDLAAFGRLLAQTLDAGDVAALQIRLKDAPDEVIAAAVDALGPIAQARGVAVILNDRPDLAKVGAAMRPSALTTSSWSLRASWWSTA